MSNGARAQVPVFENQQDYALTMSNFSPRSCTEVQLYFSESSVWLLDKKCERLTLLSLLTTKLNFSLYLGPI